FAPTSTFETIIPPLTNQVGGAMPSRNWTAPAPVKLAPVFKVCVPPQNHRTAPASVRNSPELVPPNKFSCPARTFTRPSLLKSGACDGTGVSNSVIALLVLRRVPALFNVPPNGPGVPKKVPSAFMRNLPLAQLFITAPPARPRSPVRISHTPELFI